MAIVILDGDSKGRKAQKELIESYHYPSDRIIMLDESIAGNKGEEQTIEDLFEPERITGR